MGRPRRSVLVTVAAATLAAGAGLAAWELLERRDDASPSPTRSADALVPVRYEPTGTALESCGAIDHECRRRALGDIAFEAGPAEALTAMQRVYGDAGDMECHRAAHEIGHASLARFEGDIAAAYDAGSPACFSGYYHGLFETSFLGVDRAPTQLGERAGELCATDASTETGFHQYNCLHGVGHGLLIATGDLDDSTHACRHIDGDARVRACYSGVMMEAVSPTAQGPTAWTRADDPEYPCNVVKGDEKGPCYESSGARMVAHRGGRWSIAVRDCETIDPSYRQTCIYAMGTEAADVSRWDARRTIGLCRLLSRADRATCLAGAAAATIANYGEIQPGIDVCERARTPGDDACLRGVANFIALLAEDRDEARRTCRDLLPDTSLDHCTHPLAAQ